MAVKTALLWRLLVASCSTALLLLGASPAFAQERYSASPFIDSFERLDGARWFASDGWSNGDWSANAWSARQISTRAGALRILLERRRLLDKAFASGELQSRARYVYGYFEVRMRAARGSGLVNAFFTYTRNGADRSTWDEIDVEILGRNTRRVHLTYFRNGERLGVVEDLGFDAADDFHTYAFHWTPNALRWYVDGTLIHGFENIEAPGRAQRLYLNLWNSGTLTDWVGPIPWRQRPVSMIVDCVAYAPSLPDIPICGA